MRPHRALIHSLVPFRPTFLTLEDRSTPATLTVNSVFDIVGNNGSLSLREAILIANDSTGNTKFENISSKDDFDLITFSESLSSQTLTIGGFAGTGFSIKSNLNIETPTFARVNLVTNSFFNDNSIFFVAEGFTVSIDRVNISNVVGRAIQNRANLTLIDVNITNCVTPAILNFGEITVRNCVISGTRNGAGI